ncbi:exodeoxyribonuclease VII large subunit [Lactobacillus sp. PV037]|uniref:exodeoxyribonuclease VII large subunit n=1 Tax=unclassified Lactobacillus TaxID=2620435 RepID=UPI002240D6DC|nr:MULTISPECIES: exodeoxyribonuclease VII large subunit [unclassified Lactobacillus]QNQ82079.1 exodeoxyribonuclease VII large subunit [Lactobacillus sp. PV012]QNQ83886.1 exodeoxyribonuclease VII large subunit [Lactobacillus sp. PV037]
MTDNVQFLTVSDLNEYVTAKFKNDPYLKEVYVKGEISNFRYRMNSTQYFSLKDKDSKINVVMFRSAFNKLKFKPEEGMEVYVKGRVDVYQPQGSYQFYAQEMEPVGLGALYEQFEQLKNKLAQEGLFDLQHKQTWPAFPDRIAVVTSSSGAVIHDILVTANRRFPHAQIDLYPAKVQGDEAKDSLVKALKQISTKKDEYDLVIIGRGGGSLEDLWPFNEEEVVRAMYELPIPIISSVGHETDTTLADLVADARAATPTAAAELATPDLAKVVNDIEKYRVRLASSINNLLKNKASALIRLTNAPIFQTPERLYEQRIQLVDSLDMRLNNAISNLLAHKQATFNLIGQKLKANNPSVRLINNQSTLNHLTKDLNKNMAAYLQMKKNLLTQTMQRLDGNSPLKAISKGYVYTSTQAGKTVTSVNELKKDEILNLRFKDGSAQAKIIDIRKDK